MDTGLIAEKCDVAPYATSIVLHHAGLQTLPDEVARSVGLRLDEVLGHAMLVADREGAIDQEDAQDRQEEDEEEPEAQRRAYGS
jgi:hypothetical protein